MKDLINRVQQQLDNNHAVEADDIQALVDYVKNHLESWKTLMQEIPNKGEVVLGKTLSGDIIKVRHIEKGIFNIKTPITHWKRVNS